MTKDERLRTDLAYAVTRMQEIEAQFVQTSVDRDWSKGVVAGVQMALHALYDNTSGEFGINSKDAPSQHAAVTS